MNIPEVTTRATERAPRVVLVDFNDSPPRAILPLESKPRIGEQVILTDHDGNSVHARVAAFDYRLLKGGGAAWFTTFAVDLSTWRDADAPETVVGEAGPSTQEPHPALPDANISPSDLAILRTRITAAEKVVGRYEGALRTIAGLNSDPHQVAHQIADRALTNATEQGHKHWFIFYRYEKGGERVDDPNSNICAGCGKRVPNATEQGPTGGSSDQSLHPAERDEPHGSGRPPSARTEAVE